MRAYRQIFCSYLSFVQTQEQSPLLLKSSHLMLMPSRICTRNITLSATCA
jgi:hypothetical protein